jgi:N-acyl-D-amino-acid deacylase
MLPRPVRFSLGAALPGLAALLFAAAPRAQDPPRFDLLIAGGTVVDGTGSPGRRADIGIRQGRIAAIGAIPRGRADEVLDASGLVVAPGFIDVHTHADGLADQPRADNFVRMGVTSIVAGNCGSSALDVAAAFETLRQRGASINFATLIGHNTVRRAVMGTGNRPPKPDELQRMKSLVFRAMADGAVGFSTGLQYVPGTYAGTPELIELARVAGNAGGVYASHMRNEGTELEKSITETIRIGEAGLARIQISHLKVDSPNRWGASAAALDLIDAARRRGVDVQADQYAYTAASSSLGIRFPSWALEGGQPKITERLEDDDAWAKIKGEMRGLLAERGLSGPLVRGRGLVSSDPSLNGLSMKQVAAKLVGADTADAQLEAARLHDAGGGRVDGLPLHVGRGRGADHAASARRLRVRRRRADVRVRRAAPARIRQRRARARPVREREEGPVAGGSGASHDLSARRTLPLRGSRV